MASLPKRAKLSPEDNDILVDDVLVKIIQNVPKDQWPRLELVSKQFQRCVENAYRSLQSLNLKTVILPEFGKYSKKRGMLQQCLMKLVRCCPRLQTISGFDCATDKISSSHLDLLRKLTELKNISFNNCRINIGAMSQFLKNFPLLQSLEICRCKYWHDSFKSIAINDAIIRNTVFFDFFEKFLGLVKLTITGVLGTFSGNFLSMVNAENLKVLNFSRSKFNCVYMCSLLGRCTNLEILYLFDPLTYVRKNTVGLELEVLQCLPNLPKFRKIDLSVASSGSMEYTRQDLLNILVKCKNLRDIRLQFGTRQIITDDFLCDLISKHPLLKTLDLEINPCFSTSIVAKIADLRNLTSLSIDYMEYGSSSLLGDLCANLYKLNSLSHLSIFVHVLKEAELLSLKDLKRLTSFTYFGDGYYFNENVVQKWIEAGFLQKLKYLHLCSNVLRATCKSITENVPLLENLHFQTTVNAEILLSIGENCKRLKKLDIKPRFAEKDLLKFFSICSSLKCLIYRSYGALSENILFLPYKHLIWYNSDGCFFE